MHFSQTENPHLTPYRKLGNTLAEFFLHITTRRFGLCPQRKSVITNIITRQYFF